MRHLITTGAVKRPAQLTYYQLPLLGASEEAAQLDVGCLALEAFSALSERTGRTTACATAQTQRTLATQPCLPPLVYNQALGVDPAARAAKQSASEVAEASKLMTATTFRNLALPD